MSSKLLLMELDLVIVHRTGNEYHAPDVVLKLQTVSSERTILMDDIPAMVVAESTKQDLIFLEEDIRYGFQTELKALFCNDPPTLLKLIKAHQADIYCNQTCQYVRLNGGAFT